MAKKATGKVNKAAPNKKKPWSLLEKEPAQVPSEKKKRQPKMLPRTIWLLYAQIVMARSAEEAFDVLARTFIDHRDLNYWLYRVGHAELKTLRRGHDWVEFVRLVATQLFRITRDERI